MNEVKKPKKQIFTFYIIVLCLILFFNLFIMPSIAKARVKEVDYGTFISMTEEQNIGLVEIQDNQIVFTDKAQEKIYKTGLMDDPGLTE